MQLSASRPFRQFGAASYSPETEFRATLASFSAVTFPLIYAIPLLRTVKAFHIGAHADHKGCVLRTRVVQQGRQPRRHWNRRTSSMPVQATRPLPETSFLACTSSSTGTFSPAVIGCATFPDPSLTFPDCSAYKYATARLAWGLQVPHLIRSGARHRNCHD